MSDDDFEIWAVLPRGYAIHRGARGAWYLSRWCVRLPETTRVISYRVPVVHWAHQGSQIWNELVRIHKGVLG